MLGFVLAITLLTTLLTSASTTASKSWKDHPLSGGRNFQGFFINLHPPSNEFLSEHHLLTQLYDRIAQARTNPHRRQAVYDYYSTITKLSQSSVIDQLDQRFGFDSNDLEPFWIKNTIFVRRLPLALERSEQALSAFYQELASYPGVKSITPNEVLGEIIQPVVEEDLPKAAEHLPDWNLRNINVEEAWKITQGKGVRVAAIDTGVVYKHVGLVTSYAGTRDEQNQFPALAAAINKNVSHDYAWFDPLEFRNDEWWCLPGICEPAECCLDEPFDIIGHGTHVIGSIAGSMRSGIGVAPEVTWMAAKGCRDGSCLAYGLLKSAEWVVCPTRIGGADPRCDLGADIVSNSWGSKNAQDDFYVEVVNKWREAGMIPVFAQGNQGPSCGTSNAPGDFVNVIAVGATDVDNRLARFSSRGPGPQKDPRFGRMKPDISAPGAKVLSASSKSINGYTTMSGTSMATPHVTGVLALIISAWRKNSADGLLLNWQQLAAENGSGDNGNVRDLTYDELYQLITGTANKQLEAPLGGGGRKVPLPGWPERDRCDAISYKQWPNTFYGHGLIDAARSVRAAVELFYQEEYKN